MKQLGRIEADTGYLEKDVYVIEREDDTIVISQEWGDMFTLSIRQAKELVDILVKELEYKGG